VHILLSLFFSIILPDIIKIGLRARKLQSRQKEGELFRNTVYVAVATEAATCSVVSLSVGHDRDLCKNT